MITGVVNADREAIIRLEVRGPALQVEVVDAVIDTGFDGWLTLPLALISRGSWAQIDKFALLTFAHRRI